MEIIVKSRYDMLHLKNLFKLCLSDKCPGMLIVEDPDEFRVLNTGQFIKVRVVPEYETVYKEVEYCKDSEKLDRIKEILKGD